MPQLPAFLQDLSVPDPLLPYLAEATGWRTVLPGFVHEIPLPLSWGETPVTIVRMRPGFVVPMHGHLGQELNLVLAGGLDDGDDEFLPGDVVMKDEKDSHSLDIHDDGHCIVLVVRQGPLVPKGLVARAASWLTRF